MSMRTNHIIHDVDRDGWGSAALLVAELGSSHCRVYSEARKDALPLHSQVDARPGDHIWLLDIPTPTIWANAPPLPDVPITWVDHHPVREKDAPSSNVRLVLPQSPGRTTTMHLLVEQGLVPSLVKPMEFVRTLCVPVFETPWTRVIDGLCESLIVPVPDEEMPAVLASAVRGDPVPEAFRNLETHVEKLQKMVDEILDTSEVQCTERVVAVRLRAAGSIPLKYFSLRAQRRFDRPVSILLHRNRRLYCGESARVEKEFDFLAHFESRGLLPKGHTYVATIDVPKARIEEELAVLLAALEGR
jgi:hypothetical protein